MGRHAIDLVGKRFGRLVVLERDSIDMNWQPTWLCRCDCGNTKIVAGHSLRSGDTRSCGCLRTEVFRTYMKNKRAQFTKEDMVRTLSRLGYLKTVGLTYKTARKADLDKLRKIFETVPKDEVGMG